MSAARLIAIIACLFLSQVARSFTIRDLIPSSPPGSDLLHEGNRYYHAKPPDYPKAFECFRKAADAGHPRAMNMIGCMPKTDMPGP